MNKQEYFKILYAFLMYSSMYKIHDVIYIVYYNFTIINHNRIMCKSFNKLFHHQLNRLMDI